MNNVTILIDENERELGVIQNKAKKGKVKSLKLAHVLEDSEEYTPTPEEIASTTFSKVRRMFAATHKPEENKLVVEPAQDDLLKTVEPKQISEAMKRFRERRIKLKEDDVAPILENAARVSAETPDLGGFDEEKLWENVAESNRDDNQLTDASKDIIQVVTRDAIAKTMSNVVPFAPNTDLTDEDFFIPVEINEEFDLKLRSMFESYKTDEFEAGLGRLFEDYRTDIHAVEMRNIFEAFHTGNFEARQLAIKEAYHTDGFLARMQEITENYKTDEFAADLRMLIDNHIHESYEMDRKETINKYMHDSHAIDMKLIKDNYKKEVEKNAPRPSIVVAFDRGNESVTESKKEIKTSSQIQMTGDNIIDMKVRLAQIEAAAKESAAEKAKLEEQARRDAEARLQAEALAETKEKTAEEIKAEAERAEAEKLAAKKEAAEKARQQQETDRALAEAQKIEEANNSKLHNYLSAIKEVVSKSQEEASKLHHEASSLQAQAEEKEAKAREMLAMMESHEKPAEKPLYSFEQPSGQNQGTVVPFQPVEREAPGRAKGAKAA